MQVLNNQIRDALHPASLIFIEAITNASNKPINSDEIRAIDFLVSSLISRNIWPKFRAIYPFIGRSTISTSFNLKNPYRHRIVWYNNLIFNENGITNFAKSGYGNTFVAPSWFSDNNIHVSVYNRTEWVDADLDTILIGSTSKTTSEWMHSISLRKRPLQFVNNDPSKGISIPQIFTYSCGTYPRRSAGFDAGDFANSQAKGLIVGVNGIDCYINGNKRGRSGLLTDAVSLPINPPLTGTNQVTIETFSQFPFLLFSNGPFGSLDNKKTGFANIAFASIGDGLSENDNKIFYNIVQEFQSILNRAVDDFILGEFDINVNETNPRPTCAIKVNKLTTLKTRQLYEFKDEFSDRFKKDKENVKANLKINKIEVFGPRRFTKDESLGANVSILSFNEI